ncbi:MAG: hypothetical protein K9H25_12165 [Rhodospirillum sp.]|nr:hypothetical protein [Rhodospirillum sp.]MCF8490007.1 hypothetical protein [Rhodospirillum sp.]MCF8498842.1 hypothetical protein [Rhodospirillum sp.]
MAHRSRRHNWTRASAEEALARIIATADIVGHRDAPPWRTDPARGILGTGYPIWSW